VTADHCAQAPERDTIVIVAPKSDIHAASVEHVLRTQYDIDVLVWDTEHVDDGISFRFDPESLTLAAQGDIIDLARVRSVWWRRPCGYGLERQSLAPTIRQFCQREYASLLMGGIAALDTTFVNQPHAESVAQLKPMQLATARRVGLQVPETLISNDATQVREFWERHDRDCVYKTLTPTPARLTETRQLTAADLQYLPALCLAPIIVQRRLAGVDVRLTVIGSRQYAAVARTERPEAAVDWRLDLTLQWQPYALDRELGTRVRQLLNELGLHYGCVDLRLDESGTPHFLEVNPSGQFLFIEVDTGQPVVAAMCELLLDPGAARLT
jgi:hypothetical protein